MSPLLSVSSLVVGYARPLLTLPSLRLRAGEVTALLGANGAGKSTLLRAIAGLQPALSGEITVGERALSQFRPAERARAIAWVPQSGVRTEHTVWDAVMLGRRPHGLWRPSPRDAERVTAALDRLDLGPLRLRPLTELSGGEFQRVLLARALAQESPVLILDEPTAGLDPRAAIAVSKLLRTLAREGNRTVLVAMHDLSLALSWADHFALAVGGAVMVSPDPTAAQLEAVYGVPVSWVEVGGRRVAMLHHEE